MRTMDPFTMAKLLVGDARLTPDQLAQLRTINSKYFTELYGLQEQARQRSGLAAGEPPADRAPAISEADLAALDTMIARDIRDMLTEDQQTVLDRNLPKLARW